MSPIIGVCLIIWFSNRNEIVTSLLSSKIFVGTGLLSYSLYLWHYPIFAFARVKYFDYELNNIYFLILLTFLMSVVSYYIVERPFRYKIKKTIPVVLIIFFINIFTYTIVIKKNGL